MDNSENLNRYRPLENFHIVLWLVKDLSWCMLSKTMGLIMIFPTIILAIYITYLHRSDKSELLHNLAIVFWITANSIWMVGEFFYEDGLRMVALGFFVSGLISISYYYISEFFLKRKKKKKLL